MKTFQHILTVVSPVNIEVVSIILQGCCVKKAKSANSPALIVGGGGVYKEAGDFFVLWLTIVPTRDPG